MHRLYAVESYIKKSSVSYIRTNVIKKLADLFDLIYFTVSKNLEATLRPALFFNTMYVAKPVVATTISTPNNLIASDGVILILPVSFFLA